MTEVKLNSLFRVRTLLLLSADDEISGYEIAKRLGETTGQKPSSGKIYPFLHELRNFGYIEEFIGGTDKKEGRQKMSYKLTESGEELASLIQDYVRQCHEMGLYKADSELNRISYEKIWVNHQKNGEWNPPHFHS